MTPREYHSISEIPSSSHYISYPFSKASLSSDNLDLLLNLLNPFLSIHGQPAQLMLNRIDLRLTTLNYKS
jgi:hypothetical protein